MIREVERWAPLWHHYAATRVFIMDTIVVSTGNTVINGPNMKQNSTIRVDAVNTSPIVSLDKLHRLCDRFSLIWMGKDHQFQSFPIVHRIPSSTLIDSTPGVLHAWDEFRKQYTHLPSNIAHLTHGRRLTDTLREHCNITDEEELKVKSNNVRQLWYK